MPMKQVLTFSVLLGLLVLSVGAHAAPLQWNVEGSWTIGYEIQDGNYNMQLTISTENFITGTFIGTDGQNNSIAGTVSSSSISFTDPSIPGGYTSASFSGTVASDGTISGAMQGNNTGGTWTGFFYTVTGAATTPKNAWGTASAVPVAVSLPATALLKGLIYVVGGCTSCAPQKLNARTPPRTKRWSC
jgi:hypothetical protein